MSKRLFDIVVSAVLLVLASPILLLTALAIRLGSRGPSLFHQTRVGKDGVPFEILKFRTMVADADRLGPVITTAGDPRITRIGAWLRRTKLDELPQLVNVLRGDMSFVGPRPEVPKYVALYTVSQREVLSVRPGITGISQVEMRDEEALLDGVADIEGAYIQRLMPAKLRLDLEYVRSQSFALDLSILLRTAFRLSDVPRERGARQRHSLGRLLLRYRRIPIVLAHLLIVALSNYAAFLLRFDGRPPTLDTRAFWEGLPWLVMIRGLVFVPFGLYEGLWRYTSTYDLRMLLGGIATSSAAFALYARGPLGPEGYSRSVLVIDAGLLLLALGGIRLMRRLGSEMALVGSATNGLLVYGAGGAGEMIVREIRQKPSFGYSPIGFIDDDSRKKGSSIHGVRVLGTSKQLPAIVKRHRPAAFLIAMPHAAPERIKAIVTALEPYNLPIKILPNLQDMLEGRTNAGQIRTLSVEDLMTRSAVGLDETPVAALVRGRRVLVTGAGGSIGSELCRQILKFQPEVLVLFERYENSLHTVRLELDRVNRSGSRIVPLIGDVTDEAGVNSAMARYQPQIVFHAAAHKHVPLMEENPREAVKNNIGGTRIVSAAADACGVDRMIFISTDKAANPSSVMGASKLVAENVVLAQSVGSGTSFSIVRFGNVLGSNGSVVPMFREQIARGGPVTVTHPDVRRYFMMIPEAVSLVLHAAAKAHSGDTFVLDMGEQIKIVDLARNLIRQAGHEPEKDIEIVFTGLRPGEKLTEELVSHTEQLEPSGINNVSRVVRSGPSTGWVDQVRQLEASAATNDGSRVIAELWALVNVGVEPHEPAGEGEPEAPSQDSSPKIPCPSCHEGIVIRSRARTRSERVRKRLTSLRLYRCGLCGWRGWREPAEMVEVAYLPAPAAPDLAALDAGTSHIAATAGQRSAKPRRRGKFSPRDL